MPRARQLTAPRAEAAPLSSDEMDGGAAAAEEDKADKVNAQAEAQAKHTRPQDDEAARLQAAAQEAVQAEAAEEQARREQAGDAAWFAAQPERGGRGVVRAMWSMLTDKQKKQACKLVLAKMAPMKFNRLVVAITEVKKLIACAEKEGIVNATKIIVHALDEAASCAPLAQALSMPVL